MMVSLSSKKMQASKWKNDHVQEDYHPAIDSMTMVEVMVDSVNKWRIPLKKLS